jgi:hypothetical protein
MPVTTTTIALGRWENRTSLDYRPVNAILSNGRRYGPFGVPISQAGDTAEIRRPYRIDEQGSTTYIMYDDDQFGDVPVYRVVEG